MRNHFVKYEVYDRGYHFMIPENEMFLRKALAGQAGE